ncbi:MAG: IS701 family transposase [Chloroflexota bacterium]
MTQRMACPPVPGPVEGYALQFDDLFSSLAQRRGFRTYLQGLLLPRDRNKTLTRLIGAEPVVGAQAAPVQQLQFFLSESNWDAQAVNQRRLELAMADPATRPHEKGVLVIDDTGDRKDGTKTDHVARQYLGSVGKIDNGIVAVTSLWADERVYYPLHVCPYTPASRLPKGKTDPTFRTKPQIAVELVDKALSAGVEFRAVVADCGYGDSADFEETLLAAGLPFVLGVKPSKGMWAPAEAIHTPEEAALELRWGGEGSPGDWTKVVRRFRDGHEESWWAAHLAFGPYGPDKRLRMVVVTTDPEKLPDLTTWYLVTNLPRPGSVQAEDSPLESADLAEVVRLYGLRNWVEQGYKQVKGELGWADFMVRADVAIRRHWHLVCCAFSFCWQAWFASEGEGPPVDPGPAETELIAAAPLAEPEAGRGKNHRQHRRGDHGRSSDRAVAGGLAAGTLLAGPLGLPVALLASVVRLAPAAGATSPTRLGR